MAKKKANCPNRELVEVAVEARKSGMSYGKYVAKRMIKEQMREIRKTSQEKQEKCIEIACKECGLGSQAVWFSKDLRPTTPAQKMMQEIINKETFPAKISFMFCDELDMCFFYGPDGTARCTYSGTAKAGSDDIKHNLVMAFKTAEQVLEKMQSLYTQ